jgi:thioredoxin-like negative regulator of GroEL
MNIIDIIKLIVTQICFQPVLMVICLPALFIGFNIFTLKATTERIHAARQQGKSILPTLMLALPSPIGFLLALGLLTISYLAAPGLYILLIVLLVVGIPLALLVYGFLHLPDILRYLWELIGPFGERLLHFIESSPNRVLERLRDAWGGVITQVTLYFTTHSHPKLLSDPLVHSALAWIGLSSETLLEQYVHNPYIRHKQPVKVIHSLGRMHAIPNLLRLGKDPNTTDTIRSMAAAELEYQKSTDEAAIVWDALGRQSSATSQQLQAVEHLIRLNHLDQSQEILNNILSKEDLNPRWVDKVHSLKRRMGQSPTDPGATPPDNPISQDPSDRLRKARILVNDGLSNQAAGLLSEIAASPEYDFRIRHQAINDLLTYGMRDSLIRILADKELTIELRFLVIQSLERMGEHALAVSEYRTMAQADSAPLRIRVDAAAALARLDQSDSTHDLLLRLTGHPDRDSQLRAKLALTLQQAGWRDEASQVLAELIEDPTTDKVTRKIIERDLARLKSS